MGMEDGVGGDNLWIGWEIRGGVEMGDNGWGGR